MDFELYVVKGRSATQALKLAQGVNTVGRHDGCTIRIKSSQVSRKHCEIFEKRGTLLVKDLGSANGTFVNGKKVEGQQALEPGDELTIGGVMLRVARVGEAPPVKPARPVKSSDTAVAEVVDVAGEEDEFEIDFDEDPVAADAALNDDALEIDLEDDLVPSSPPPAAPSPDKPRVTESKKPAAPPPIPKEAPAAEAADEAIADFLLDIKLDDED